MEEERKHFIYGNEEIGIAGCIKNGISEEIASTLYDQMFAFASYGFNKSHAAAYAAIAMQTAYLKCHYPSEFYAGILTSVMDKTEKLAVYISECKKKKIKILPPDVNVSGKEFTVTVDGSVTYGLVSIKKIGEEVVDEIIKEREKNGPYKGLYDFISRVPQANSGAVDNLIHAGAFDFCGYNRRTLHNNIPSFYKRLKYVKDHVNPDQFCMFDDDDPGNTPEMVICDEYSVIEKAVAERMATGQFISYHPVEAINEKYKNGKYKYCPLNLLKKYSTQAGDKTITIAGIITRVNVFLTKKNYQKMAFITIDDGNDTVNVVVFPTIFKTVEETIAEDKLVKIIGKVSVKDDEVSFIADNIMQILSVPTDSAKEC